MKKYSNAQLILSIVTAYVLGIILVWIIKNPQMNIKWGRETTATQAVTKQKVSISKTPTQEPLAEAGTLSPYAPIFTTLDGAVFWANSAITTKEWDEMIYSHARNLALPSQYLWEFYGLPVSTRYQDVYDHYYNLLTGLGYRLTFNDQGAYEVFLMKFKGPSDAVTIQFWGNWNGREPMLLLFRY